MDGDVERTTIETIRSLLGNHDALLEYLERLQRPLSPIVREYLEAHIGAWGQREIKYQFLIKRLSDGVYAQGSSMPFWKKMGRDKAKVWKTPGAVAGAVKSMGARNFEGCVVLAEKVVTYTETLGTYDLTTDPLQALEDLKQDTKAQQKKRNATKIPNKDLVRGGVYSSLNKTSVFRGWATSKGGTRLLLWSNLNHPPGDNLQASFDTQRSWESRTTPQKGHSFYKKLGQIRVKPVTDEVESDRWKEVVPDAPEN